MITKSGILLHTVSKVRYFVDTDQTSGILLHTGLLTLNRIDINCRSPVFWYQHPVNIFPVRYYGLNIWYFTSRAVFGAFLPVFLPVTTCSEPYPTILFLPFTFGGLKLFPRSKVRYYMTCTVISIESHTVQTRS